MMASRTGNVAAMKVLLDRGADVNAKETPARDDGADVGRGPGPSGGGQAPDRARRRRRTPARTRRRAAGAAYPGKVDDPRKSNRALAGRRGGCDAAKRSSALARAHRGRRAARGRSGRRAQRQNRPAAGCSVPASRPCDDGAPVQEQDTERRRSDAAGLRRARQFARAVKTLLAAGADMNQTDRLRLDAAARRRRRTGTTSSGRSCSTRARTRTSPTRAAGRRCISPWTTATSKAATIRSARATWTIWSSSRSSSTRARTSTRG